MRDASRETRIFRIREGNYYDVDKTAYARRLVSEGSIHYVLSRSRRFGKSLFVDMLKEVFDGSRAPFSGLAVHDERDWSARHPALRLEFSQSEFRRPGKLPWDVMDRLAAIERAAGLPAGRQESAGIRCRNLIQALHGSARKFLPIRSGRTAGAAQTVRLRIFREHAAGWIWMGCGMAWISPTRLRIQIEMLSAGKRNVRASDALDQLPDAFVPFRSEPAHTIDSLPATGFIRGVTETAPRRNKARVTISRIVPA